MSTAFKAAKAQALATSRALRDEARATQVPTDPGLISGWTVGATCVMCGHVLTHVADGRPAGVRTRAVARCSGCDITLLIDVTLTPAHTAKRGRAVA